MSIQFYNEDESHMFLTAIRFGMILPVEQQYVTLTDLYSRDGMVAWCVDQWPDQHVICCPITMRKPRQHTGQQYPRFIYQHFDRFYFQTSDHAILFKLVYSNELAEITDDLEIVYGELTS